MTVPPLPPFATATLRTLSICVALVLLLPLQACAQEPEPIAIVGATLIDGNGGPPVENATLVVVGREIVEVGPGSEVSVPAGAREIDGTGRYLLPGFIDANTHTALYGGGQTLALYHDRQADIVKESAQLHLKHGVTTIRDSYGALEPLMEIRDAIEEGRVIGPRMRVAGNIVGWGGPCSVTYSMVRPETCDEVTREFNESITMGVSGEDLLQMTPEELRVAFRRYLDLGPDHIRYGATTHFTPAFIAFSPDAQRVLVEEAHARGMPIETHSTTIEGVRIPIRAGVDLLQHPEVLVRPVPEEVLELIREHEVICAFRASVITGDAWQAHLESGNALEGEGLSLQRRNAERFITEGCIPAVGNDNYLGNAPELMNSPRSDTQKMGIGTLIAIEGLVELGLTPSEAIVAATRNGAMAARGLDRFGTLEAGKLADLILLDGNPLEDISNIRTLSLVMKEGAVIDHESLPTQPVWWGHENYRE
jgi:imidazolonepropionase-like amidohydrolase